MCGKGELPCPLWACHFPSTSTCLSTWELPKPYSFEFLLRLHYPGMINLIITHTVKLISRYPPLPGGWAGTMWPKAPDTIIPTNVQREVLRFTCRPSKFKRSTERQGGKELYKCMHFPLENVIHTHTCTHTCTHTLTNQIHTNQKGSYKAKEKASLITEAPIPLHWDFPSFLLQTIS